MTGVDATVVGDGPPVWAARFTGDVLRSGGTERVHDHAALAFFTGGSAVVSQGERFEVRSGEVYLVPAGQKHGIVEARSPEAWGVRFSPACYASGALDPLLDPFARAASGGAKVIPIPGGRQDHLASLCSELHRESARAIPSPFARRVGESLLALILAEIARGGSWTSKPRARAGLVSDALRFIERRCLGPLSLGDVAAHVHRSPSHVSTVVRRATGKSVKQWIIAGRLAEARSRLLYTDEMVDVIAERVGYADPTHFIRLFRREHGCTPAAWRHARRASG